MAATSKLQHLEMHGNVWRVRKRVPDRAVPILGKTRLTRSLGTSDFNEANRLKHAHLLRMNAEIAEALGQSADAGNGDYLAAIQLGLKLREKRADHEWRVRTGKRDHPLNRIDIELQSHWFGEASSKELGALAFDIAMGKRTPFAPLIDDWFAEHAFAERTKQSARHSVRKLETWLLKQGLPATIESVDNEVASRFRVQTLLGTMAAATANKHINALRSLWKWLVVHGRAQANPWLGKSVPKGRKSRSERERPFTDMEVETLLSGTCSALMLDAIKIAALSGMRREEIFQLKVGDCRGGIFEIHWAKTEAGERRVPIHSGLAEIIERRSKGKALDEYLLPSGTQNRRTSKPRPRGDAFGKAFARYREGLQVHDRAEGRKRSRVDFHSFRRWFATKCEHAGHQEHLVARVLGHAVSGMSFGRYSGGASIEQLRYVIESVKIPDSK